MTAADAGFAIREVTLAKAGDLARQGRYAEARGILEEAWQDAEPTAAYLDLLARIHAQQGNLDAADDCWERAERLQPGEKEYAAARRRIARMRGRRTVSIPAAIWAVAFLAVAAVVIVMLVSIRSDVSSTQRGQRALAGQIARPPAPRPAPSVDVLGAVAQQVRLPGVRVRRSPNEVAITFRSGLFRDGTRLTPTGRATVAKLGARLRAYANRVAVALIGHTDNVAAVGGTSNVDLGIARAVVVREMLSQASGIPTVRFAVSSAGSALPPFKGDSARNRTVSVRISTTP